MALRAALVIWVCFLVLLSSREASAQHFGRNKVEYVDFDFRIFETEHFAIYHYSNEEDAARIMARLAERWYARLSNVLQHELDTRQLLILYASQPEFAQTNVVDGLLGEGVGGVTESARRRIVMPFAPTLAETDRILGHELTHAFQFEMARRYGGGMTWPLWAIEGLAQYLAFGATDGETSMWLRDAVRFDLVPDEPGQAARKFSPYRYGHAFWAFLAGRYGDRIIPDILKAKGSSSIDRRLEKITGLKLDELFAEWREAADDLYGTDANQPLKAPNGSGVAAGRGDRLNLGPSLSPDGRHVIFFSARDRMSLDLFLADASTGVTIRKLATTAAAVRFESLQAIRSAGAWSPAGNGFVCAAIERGQPTLLILDPERPSDRREIPFPQFGQILSPSWSPDGRAIAFTALEGGITDLYVYDLHGGELRKLTDDLYADLQPVWSPDGGRIAFVTDRFSTDLSTLDFGSTELAVVEVASGSVLRLPGIPGAGHLQPQWSRDGESLFFVSDANAVSNVYRLHLESGIVGQVTDVPGGVAGLTAMSPALSVAHAAPVLAFSVFRNGQYEIEIRSGEAALAGTPPTRRPTADPRSLPPGDRADGVVEQMLEDSRFGLPEVAELTPRPYESDLSLEAIGSPYMSSGGGPFGRFIRGGGSLLFGDLLGERKVAIAAQAGSRLRDLAIRVAFINRERRWNWGAMIDAQPSIRRLPSTRFKEIDGEPAIVREHHYFDRTQFRLAGLLAYPFDRAQRIEFDAGARHTLFRHSVAAIGRSRDDGRIITRTFAPAPAGAPVTIGEASAAYVRDTAVFGPTSPILGSRSRLEVTSTFGELSTARLLVDHRRYMMPIKPYTVATRVLHMGHYGPDADDPRLLPAFLGSRQFVRGYDWGTVSCVPADDDKCGALEELLGRRLLVANVEMRVPLMGIHSRDLRYGPVPLEGFLFADSGLVWARSPAQTGSSGRRLISSFGTGVRVNAFGFPLELSIVRAVDRPSAGWSFDFSFRPGF